MMKVYFCNQEIIMAVLIFRISLSCVHMHTNTCACICIGTHAHCMQAYTQTPT